MTDEQTQNAPENTPPPPPEKTFTQAEVDDIVQKRLNRERKQFEGWIKPDDHAAVLSTVDDLTHKVQGFERKEFVNGLVSEYGIDPDVVSEINDNNEAEAHAALVKSVADDIGVPADLLFGKDEASLRARGEKLAALNPTRQQETPGDRSATPHRETSRIKRARATEGIIGHDDFHAIFNKKDD